MKTRMSLEAKIQACMQYGTLKTYSFIETAKLYKEMGYSDKDVNDIVADAYKRGKYMVKFISKVDWFESVAQLSSLAYFVREIVYPLIEDELETV